jgi:ADP-ribose pyrophosphatase YjhB (NUDIX family)
MGHIHGDSEYDFTVSAMIVHDEKVLLLFHHKMHLWLPPAGHVELNETTMEALYREIEEETGLTKNHLTLVLPYDDNLSIVREKKQNQVLPVPFDMDVYTVTESGHRHIDLSYIMASDTDEVRPEVGGAEKLQWFALNEIEQLSPMPRKVYGLASYAVEKVKESQR